MLSSNQKKNYFLVDKIHLRRPLVKSLPHEFFSDTTDMRMSLILSAVGFVFSSTEKTLSDLPPVYLNYSRNKDAIKSAKKETVAINILFKSTLDVTDAFAEDFQDLQKEGVLIDVYACDYKNSRSYEEFHDICDRSNTLTTFPVYKATYYNSKDKTWAKSDLFDYRPAGLFVTDVRTLANAAPEIINPQTKKEDLVQTPTGFSGIHIKTGILENQGNLEGRHQNPKLATNRSFSSSYGYRKDWSQAKNEIEDTREPVEETIEYEFIIPLERIVTKVENKPKENLIQPLEKIVPKVDNKTNDTPIPTETVKDSKSDEIKKGSDQIPAEITKAVEQSLLNLVDQSKKDPLLGVNNLKDLLQSNPGSSGNPKGEQKDSIDSKESKESRGFLFYFSISFFPVIGVAILVLGIVFVVYKVKANKKIAGANDSTSAV
jgi:hypothetical protein